jgi:hypothetical protein
MTNISDFIPNWEDPEDNSSKGKQSVEQMKEILLSIADMQNKKVSKDKKRSRTTPPKNLQK